MSQPSCETTRSSLEQVFRTVLEKKLLDILVCPETKGPLVYKVARNELWSVEAGLAYTVKDDIPVLIAADARLLSDEEIKELKGS